MEAYVIAANGQSLFAGNLQANIIYTDASPICTLWEYVENIELLMSDCPILISKEYKIVINWTIYSLDFMRALHSEKIVRTSLLYRHRKSWANYSLDITIPTERQDIVIKVYKQKKSIWVFNHLTWNNAMKSLRRWAYWV